MFAIEYRSSGPVPEHPDMIGYTGRYETDDPSVFGEILGEIEERSELTLISVEFNGQKVPTFYPLSEG
jgi:hypothetical protein